MQAGWAGVGHLFNAALLPAGLGLLELRSRSNSMTRREGVGKHCAVVSTGLHLWGTAKRAAALGGRAVPPARRLDGPDLPMKRSRFRR